jgi:hypothetical protein
MTDKQPNQHSYPQNYPPYEDEINLIDYLRVIWKWKIFIVLMVILCAGLTTGFVMVKYPIKYVTDCTISLNFPGIEKHHNPNGSLFSKEQIITPAILTKASAFLWKKKAELPEEDIREMIDIESVIPPEIQEKMEAAEKKKETFTFFPNQFSISLILERSDTFSIKERTRLLLSIVDEYRKDFEKKYGEEPLLVVKFPANFLANSDYLDAINTFKVRIDNFIKFLDSKIGKAGIFRSQKTGDSFIDVKNDLELLNNIKVSEIEATIKTLKLTKNKDNLINVYRHKIRTVDIERKKKEKEASIARKLLKDMKQQGRYETSKGVVDKKGETSLVLDTSFIKDMVKEDSFALLLRTALQAEVKAKNLEVDKEFLEEEIALLQEKEKEKEKEKEEIAYIQAGLNDIQDRIVALSKRANELNIEYLKRVVDNAVQVIRDPETNTEISKNLIMVLLAGVVALFFAIFLAFFIEYIKNVSKE